MLIFKISNVNYSNDACMFQYAKTLEEAEEIKQKEERLNQIINAKARVVIEEVEGKICKCGKLYEDEFNLNECMRCESIKNDTLMEGR